MRPKTLLTAVAVVTGIAAVMLAGGALPARASEAGHVLAAPSSLNQVINNISSWLTGLLAALATLFLTYGGVRMLLAGGDPGEWTKGKQAIKYAAIGYGVAALAKPVLVPILKQIVGV